MLGERARWNLDSPVFVSSMETMRQSRSLSNWGSRLEVVVEAFTGSVPDRSASQAAALYLDCGTKVIAKFNATSTRNTLPAAIRPLRSAGITMRI